jgi:GST-like protein
VQYAPERVPYAVDRYVNETNRLYGVLNRRLAGRDWIADDYSIADMAIYPWVVPHQRQLQDINDFAHLKAWFDRMHSRPAVVAAYEKGKPWTSRPAVRQARNCCSDRPHWPESQTASPNQARTDHLEPTQ